MLISYFDIIYEMNTLKMELEGISDPALVEECLFYGEDFQCDDLNKIGLKYGINGTLSKNDRIKLENVYIFIVK